MEKFFNFCLNGSGFLGVHLPKPLSHWFDIRIHLNFMFNDTRVNAWHFII